MFCTQCGTKVPDKGGFCPECGAPITADEAAEQVPDSTAAEQAPDSCAVGQAPGDSAAAEQVADTAATGQVPGDSTAIAQASSDSAVSGLLSATAEGSPESSAELSASQFEASPSGQFTVQPVHQAALLSQPGTPPSPGQADALPQQPQPDSPFASPPAPEQPDSPPQQPQPDSPFASPLPGHPQADRVAQPDSPFAPPPASEQPFQPVAAPQPQPGFQPSAVPQQPFQPGVPSPQPQPGAHAPQQQPGGFPQPGIPPQPQPGAPSAGQQPFQPGVPSPQPQPQPGFQPGGIPPQPQPQPGSTFTPTPQSGIPPQQFQPGAPLGQQPFPAPPQALQPQAAPKKKRKTGLFVGLGAALLVILAVVGGIVGFNIYQSNLYDEAMTYYNGGQYQMAIDTLNKLGDDYEEAAWYKVESQRWLDYEAANALLDAEDYAGAKDAFTALGDFQDSYDQMLYCQNMLDYLQAIEYFESGDYESAREMFVALVGTNFKDSSEWIDKTDYAMAEKLAADGKMYEAYKAFKDLGGYSDSAERANQCTTPFPATGILYHNEAFYSSRSAIVLDSGGSTRSAYFKIYSGTALVAAIWLNPGTSQQIELPPGDYSIKMATGDIWFGEEVMFGDEGNYRQLMFEDGSSSTYLGDNIKMTLTMAVSDGNVSGRPTDASDF